MSEQPVNNDKALTPLELENGLVKATDTDQMLRMCKAMIAAGMTPTRFKSPAEVLGATLYVRSLGLPDTAIRQVANIEGTPSIFGDLPLALVKNADVLEEFEEFIVNEQYKPLSFENKNLNDEPFAAICIIKVKGKTKKEFFFTVAEARKAGLIKDNKPESGWNKYRRDMLTYRARARALKSECPQIINAVSIMEYDFGIHPNEIKDVTPRVNINDLITGGSTDGKTTE